MFNKEQFLHKKNNRKKEGGRVFIKDDRGQQPLGMVRMRAEIYINIQDIGRKYMWRNIKVKLSFMHEG